MLRTFLYRLRIIVPHVISTLYNVLWSDSRSGHFTQLCTSWIAVPSHLVILEPSSVWFYAKQLSHFLLKRRFAVDCISFIHKFDHTHILLWSLIQSAKRCCYRKSLPEGVLRIRIFLLCIPLVPLVTKKQTNSLSDVLYSSWYCRHNTDTLYFDRRWIYYC